MLKNKPPQQVQIIGAGPAGLGTAYFAQKAGLQPQVFEAAPQVGGNASTFKWGPYRYDSGAHRFHDQLPEISSEIFELMGTDFIKVNQSSKIYLKGRFFDFPVKMGNLMTQFSIQEIWKAGRDYGKAKFQGHSHQNFKEYTESSYGKFIAQAFLIPYTEKLWGKPAEEMDFQIGSSRLKGLSITDMLRDLLGKKGKAEHLEGDFWYPNLGIGQIADRMADRIGRENIFLEHRIHKLQHDQNCILSIESSQQSWDAHQVVSSLSPSQLIHALDPLPPESICELAKSIPFRSLLLVLIELEQDRFSPYPTLYFPDQKVPFTRLTEPKNRSPKMAPKDKTLLVLEIPCDPDELREDWIEKQKEATVQALVEEKLIQKEGIGKIKTHVIHQAYPVLTPENRLKHKALLDYLSRFKNLHLCGRNANFTYTSIHHMLQEGKELVDWLKVHKFA